MKSLKQKSIKEKEKKRIACGHTSKRAEEKVRIETLRREWKVTSGKINILTGGGGMWVCVGCSVAMLKVTVYYRT